MVGEEGVEVRRVGVAELGADLKDEDFRGGFGEEAFDGVENDVDGVGDEDAVADAAVLVDADVEDASAAAELAVDGGGLALSEWARDEGDADFVGGGVVSARKEDVADVDFGWVERGHPGFVVGWVVVGARELVAGGLEKVGEDFFLGVYGFAALELFGDLGAHGDVVVEEAEEEARRLV